MAFKFFTPGSVLTATEVNDYLMKQANIVCTSVTRPSPVEGMEVYETNTGRKMIYDGSGWVTLAGIGAWTSYTPTWTGAISNPSIVNGTLLGLYRRRDDVTVDFRIVMVAGSSTTFGSGAWSFDLPVAATATQAATAFADDFSTSNRYGGSAWVNSGSASAGVFRVTLGSGGNTGVASGVPFTWAQNDRLMISGTYEAA